jgi:hypothetical protein
MRRSSHFGLFDRNLSTSNGRKKVSDRKVDYPPYIYIYIYGLLSIALQPIYCAVILNRHLLSDSSLASGRTLLLLKTRPCILNAFLRWKQIAIRKGPLDCLYSACYRVLSVPRSARDLWSSFVTQVEPRLSGAQSRPRNEASSNGKLNFRYYCSVFFQSVLETGGVQGGCVCIAISPLAHTQTLYITLMIHIYIYMPQYTHLHM